MIVVGCGYTGTRLARRELAAGRPCSGIVSSAAGVGRMQALGIHGAQWDLDTDQPAPALDFAAPIAYLAPPPQSGDDDPRLHRFLQQLPVTPTRIVYTSTTGVYGDHAGATVDETTPPAPLSLRAQRRVAAEITLCQWCEDHQVPWIVLRVPGIYGPDRLQQKTLRGTTPMLHPAAAGPGNRIQVEDLVTCLQRALITPHVNQIYNVGDGNPISNTEFVALVAAQCGVVPPPVADRDTVRAAVGARRWSFLRESRRVSTEKMRTVLGVTPRYADPGQGIAASLKEMAT